MAARKKPRIAAKRRRTMVPAEAAPVWQRPKGSSDNLAHSAKRLATSSDD